MKHHSSHMYLIFLVFFVFAIVSAKAQDTPPPDGPPKQQLAGQPNHRPNLPGLLGLSPDQIQQLRRMNAERKPMVEAANRRLHEANRALDQVIYGDAVDEGEFRMRLKEFQDAQAEVARIRFENELTLRRVLTPDQLVKFREIRQRFAEARKALKDQNRPLQNMRRMRQQNLNQPPRKLP